MPLTKMQLEYLGGCKHRWNIKTGATGSGKSFLDYAHVIPSRLLALKGEGLAVLMGNTRGTLERNVLEPMREIWPDYVGQISGDNTVHMFGRKVYALGADSKKHVARIQGATIEYAYGDEITTWAQGVFEMLKSRLRCSHSHFDGTCNPDHPGHWFKKFLDSNADIFQQSYTIDDNPFLPKEFVASLKEEYAGTVYYDRYIRGLWTAADGLIYPNFSRCVVPDVPTQFDRYIVSMDYGIQNATAMLLWGRCGGRWYCLREYYYSGREQREPKTDDDYLAAYRKLTKGLRISKFIVDPSAASFITLAQRKGVPILTAENDVLGGIRETSSAIQRGQIKVHKACVRTLGEAEGYMWDEKEGEDKPVKVNDHAMDAMRYFVYTELSTKKTAIAAK